LLHIKKILLPYFELCTWIAGLFLLAIMNPAGTPHFSLCLFKWAGLSFCPGCGLGHSISWLFHGNLTQSLQAHPLGIFALAVLLLRIFTLIKNNFFNLTTIKP
jgi:Protein of unknown function (DUF2752)